MMHHYRQLIGFIAVILLIISMLGGCRRQSDRDVSDDGIPSSEMESVGPGQVAREMIAFEEQTERIYEEWAQLQEGIEKASAALENEGPPYRSADLFNLRKQLERAKEEKYFFFCCPQKPETIHAATERHRKISYTSRIEALNSALDNYRESIEERNQLASIPQNELHLQDGFYFSGLTGSNKGEVSKGSSESCYRIYLENRELVVCGSFFMYTDYLQENEEEYHLPNREYRFPITDVTTFAAMRGDLDPIFYSGEEFTMLVQSLADQDNGLGLCVVMKDGVVSGVSISS